MGYNRVTAIKSYGRYRFLLFIFTVLVGIGTGLIVSGSLEFSNELDILVYSGIISLLFSIGFFIMWMACQIEVMDECICFLEESSTKENIEESLLKRNVSISEFDSSQTPVSNLLTSPTNSSISSIEVGTILKTSSLISELSEDIEQSCTNESANQPLQLQEESDAICVIDERTSQSRSIFSRATRVFPMEVPAQNEKTLISTRKDSHSHIDESELETIKPEELSFPRTNFSQKSNTTILEPIPRSEPHHIELPADLGVVGNPIAPIERPSRLPPINFGTIHK